MPRTPAEPIAPAGMTPTERRALAIFLGAIGVAAVTWLLGFALRGSIWAVDMELIRRSGVSSIYGNTVTQLTNTFLLLTVVSAAYLAALWALRSGFPRSFPLAVAGCAVVSLAVLPVAPLTSPDAMHLAADVRTLWLHGEYPGSGLPGFAATTPGQVDDPVAREVRVFANAPSSYGPVAYAIGGAPLPVVRDNVRANVLGVKVVAAAFLVLTALATGLVARELGMNAGLAAAFIGLNPLMLWEFTGDGHNDTIMATFGMLALLLVLRQPWPQRAAGAGFAVLSAASKYAMAIASPLVLAYWFPRWRLVFAAGVLLAGGYVTVKLLTGIDAGPDVSEIGPAVGLSKNTPWYVVSHNALEGASDARMLRVHEQFFGVAYLVLTGIAVAIVARYPLRTRQDLVAAVALLMFAFLFLASPSLRHWYQVWYLPFIPLCGRRWLVAAGLTFSVGAFLTILAANWSAVIKRDMGIATPLDNSVVFLWVATAAATGVVWWMDQERGRREALAEARRQQRRLPGGRQRSRA